MKCKANAIAHKRKPVTTQQYGYGYLISTSYTLRRERERNWIEKEMDVGRGIERHTHAHKRKGFEERNRDTEILSSYITLILYGNLHHGDRHVTISNIPLMFYQFWGFYNLSLCYPFMADACAHFHLHIHGLMFVVIIPVARFFFFPLSSLMPNFHLDIYATCNMQRAFALVRLFSLRHHPYRYMNI